MKELWFVYVKCVKCVRNVYLEAPQSVSGVFVVATPEDGVGAVVLAVRWVVVDVI